MNESEYEKRERLRKIRYWEAKIRVAESHIEKHKKALEELSGMTIREAINIILAEATSSALGDNNKEVLEALKIARKALEELG